MNVPPPLIPGTPFAGTKGKGVGSDWGVTVSHIWLPCHADLLGPVAAPERACAEVVIRDSPEVF